MLLRDLYSISLNSLLLHKVRSLLTSLGIIFGVGSVIAMLAISGGAKRAALSQIESMGIDNIIVYTRAEQGAGAADSETRIFKYGMTDADLSNIRKMDNIRHISTARDVRAKIYRGVEVLDLQMFWVSPRFLPDINCDLVKGRWLLPSDYKNAATVCVVGRNVKRKLFSLGEKEVLHKTIHIAGGTFRVVGVVENTKGTKLEGVNSIDDSIFIPSTTGRGLFRTLPERSAAASSRFIMLNTICSLLKWLIPRSSTIRRGASVRCCGKRTRSATGGCMFP